MHQLPTGYTLKTAIRSNGDSWLCMSEMRSVIWIGH